MKDFKPSNFFKTRTLSAVDFTAWYQKWVRTIKDTEDAQPKLNKLQQIGCRWTHRPINVNEFHHRTSWRRRTSAKTSTLTQKSKSLMCLHKTVRSRKYIKPRKSSKAFFFSLCTVQHTFPKSHSSHAYGSAPAAMATDIPLCQSGYFWPELVISFRGIKIFT